jgi:hypothetical protein
MKHKHYDVIVAWAEGKPIQYMEQDKWLDWTWGVNAPGFSPSYNYRIKPEKKSDGQMLFEAIYPECSWVVTSVGSKAWMEAAAQTFLSAHDGFNE